jgi:hypothetical protein
MQTLFEKDNMRRTRLRKIKSNYSVVFEREREKIWPRFTAPEEADFSTKTGAPYLWWQPVDAAVHTEDQKRVSPDGRETSGKGILARANRRSPPTCPTY